MELAKQLELQRGQLRFAYRFHGTLFKQEPALYNTIMLQTPKLSFRQNPLRLPVKKKEPLFLFSPDIEAPKAPVLKSSKPTEAPLSPTALPTKRITLRILFFGFVLILVVRLLQVFLSEEELHTIYKLSCRTKNRVLTCKSTIHTGTFIVEIPPKCSNSVYEIGGLPFSVARQGNVFKAPAKDLTVKSIDGDCKIKAFVDSHKFQAEIPFTWVTTKKHTWFSIRVNGKIVVERADASLFESTENGIWIAYTYDLSLKNKHVEVFGDGGDVIFVYGVLP